MNWPQDFVDELICSDCLNILPKIPDGSIDLVLTDIPYGVVNRPSGGLRSLDKGDADVLTFKLAVLLHQLIRICKGSIYIFCATEQAGLIRETFEKFSLSARTCIWEKTNPSPMNGQYLWLSGIELCVYGKKCGAVFNEHCKNPVWRYASVSKRVHPTQKPVPLFEYLIEVSSNIGDIVLDPCMGSGTTAIAAIRTGRRYVGIDVNEEYVAIAEERIKTETA